MFINIYMCYVQTLYIEIVKAVKLQIHILSKLQSAFYIFLNLSRGAAGWLKHL